MYADLIKEKFPHDEGLDLYKAPQLPAVKLGKVLMKDTRIASPNDVLGLHLWSGFLGGGFLAFTQDRVYYDGGEFALEDVKGADAKGDKILVTTNLQGQLIPHEVDVKNEAVAKALARILEAISALDPKAEAALSTTYDPERYSAAEIDWLKLRDEVMRTIDFLYERYNDGKLNMLEYESKKEELLGRL
ncbi:MAG: hypothetical protein NWR72_13230 [Bacteroidia bacterium]|nr:hypothetical protein [Bacteroidia bacterium]